MSQRYCPTCTNSKSDNEHTTYLYICNNCKKQYCVTYTKGWVPRSVAGCGKDGCPHCNVGWKPDQGRKIAEF